jgi:hypothetical protein
MQSQCDADVIATVQGRQVIRGEIRRSADFWMAIEASLTRDAAVQRTIVQVIDRFITQAEVERRQLTPTREEAEDYMRRCRAACLGEHGAECCESVVRLGFDPSDDQYSEDTALPKYGNALGEIRLLQAVIEERGPEDTGNEQLFDAQRVLPGELRENAVVVWHDDDLKRAYQQALSSE